MAKEKQPSWEEAFAKFFKAIELRVRYGVIMATPAVEIKRLAMDIIWQATRKDRANSDSKYLITDLELIEKGSEKIMDIIDN